MINDRDEHQQMEETVGQGIYGKGRGVSTSSLAHLSQHFCVFTNLKTLWTTCFWDFWQGKGLTLYFQPPFPLWTMRSGVESSKLLTMAWSFQWPCRTPPDSPHWNKEHFPSARRPGDLEVWCQGQCQEILE